MTVAHWRTELAGVLGAGLEGSVLKARRVTQTRGDRTHRFDVWVSSDDAQAVLERLRTARGKTGWYARAHRSYLERRALGPAARRQDDRSAGVRPGGQAPAVATWNVGTLRGRRPEVAWDLSRHQISVASLQETLNGPESWPLRLSGFSIIERKADFDVEGARGVALVVSDRLSSHELNYPHPNAVWGRVSGLLAGGSATVGAVYVPQRDHKARRKDALDHVKRTLTAELRKHPDTPLLVMGDWNMTPPTLERLLARWGLPLTVLRVRGDAGTYHRPGGRGRSHPIDHMVVNAEARGVLCNAVVRRDMDLSDHWPLVARIQPAAVRPPVTRAPGRPCVLREGLRERAPEVAHHNYWTPLLGVMEDGGATLTTQLLEFGKTAHAVAADLGCSQPARTGQRRYHTLSRETKRLVDRRRRLAGRLRSAPEHEVAHLTEVWRSAAAAAKQGVRADSTKAWQSFIEEGAQLLHGNRTRQFWRWVKCLNGGGRPSRAAHPVADAAGKMQTDPVAIREVFTEHYRKLARDPSARSLRWWRTHRPLPKRTRLAGLNSDVSWIELNAALQALQSGKAPGADGVPPELFKAAFEADPHGSPGTPLGRVLLRLARSIWAAPEDATPLHSALVVSIPKAGDMADVDNYRGISLIAIVQKLVTRVVAGRLQRGFKAGLVLAREQAGFLAKEECLAQVASLLEVAQRRKWGWGRATYAAFIDFRKAFDTVPHNALFHKLWAAGVRGHCLRFIKSLYAHSTLKAAVGDGVGEEVRLERGVRQGCPLSPILFDLFINDLLAGVPGVRVPGLAPGERVPGLLFADDGLALAPTAEGLRRALDSVGRWAATWGMATNGSKCGVMVLMHKRKHERAKGLAWRLCGETVPVKDTYKYLGVQLDPALRAETHVSYRAGQALKALQANRHMLVNRSIPAHLRILAMKTLIYPALVSGGEVIGLKDERVYRPLQRLLKMGLSWIVQGGGKASASAGALMQEMGMPPAVAAVAGAKARALAKYPTLDTWAARLTTTAPRTGRRRTWAVNGKALVSRLLGGDPAAAVALPKGKGRMVLRARWKAHARRDATRGMALYRAAGFQATRSYLTSSMTRPALARGVGWLMRARTSCLWTANRAAAAGLIVGQYRDRCPSCGVLGKDTMAHLLLRCVAYGPQREASLNDAILALRAWVGAHPAEGWVSGADANLATLLLGGSVGGTVPPQAVWDFTGSHSDGGDPGFAKVARFLQEVMPAHASKIWSHSVAPRADAPRGVGQPSSSGARD